MLLLLLHDESRHHPGTKYLATIVPACNN